MKFDQKLHHYFLYKQTFICRNLGLQSSKMLNPEAYLLGTTLPLCQQISGLSNGQQKLCMLYTDHMMHVGRGARRGIAECKFQFNERKWNCSTVEDSTVFGPILSIRKCNNVSQLYKNITNFGVLFQQEGKLSKSPAAQDNIWLMVKFFM